MPETRGRVMAVPVFRQAVLCIRAGMRIVVDTLHKTSWY